MIDRVSRLSLALLLAVTVLSSSAIAAPPRDPVALRAHKQEAKAKVKSAGLPAAGNDHSCSHTSPISCGASVNAQLQAGDCILEADGTLYDQYSIQVPLGQFLTIDATSAALDMYLVLLGPDGAVAAEDDDGGTDLNARISHIAAVEGTFTILVNALSGTGAYTLSVSGCEIIPPCTRPDTPIGCNTTTTTALGGDDCRFSDGSYFEAFTFEGVVGQLVTIDMRSAAFDALVALFDPSGVLLEVGDDTGTSSDATLTVTLPQTGTYSIVATSFEAAPTPGPYTLQLTCGVPPACSNGPEQLCLNGRFLVTVAWKDFSGNTGPGKAVELTADSGSFWFFNAANLELMVKALDGRANNGKWWIFYGALSNVEYTITVKDTETGQTKTYFNPLNEFGSRGDTNAF